MIFKSIRLKEGFFERAIIFSEGVNLIHSEKNSCGKTTLLRFMLYALGYNIPNTRKIKFDRCEVELVIECETVGEILLLRHSDIAIEATVKDQKRTFVLPEQQNDLHTIIFGTENVDILGNLLGAFYVDQEKGWAIIWKQISKDLYDTNEITSKVKLSKENVFSCIVNRKVLGMSIGFFCYNYIKNFYLTWFPSYLVSEKGFSILKVGIWGMLPSIAAVFGGLIAGTITDKMISNGHSKTLSRKLPLCVGLICSGSIVFADSVHSGYLAVALLSFSFAMAIAASPSIWAIPGDIAPDSNLVGTIGGIQNTVSNIAGIVAPIITGYIIYKTGGFKVALLASGIISCIGAFSYIFVVGKLEAIDIGN